jgi:hypothetical protein
MEPRERALSIAIVTLTVGALAVRTQSTGQETTVQVVEQSSPAVQRAEIPVSSGLGLPSQGTRFQVFADRDQPEQSTSQSRAPDPEMSVPEMIADDQSVAEEPQTLVLAPAPMETEPDVFISLADDYSMDDPWTMTDQEVIDQMLTILNSDQRAAFRSMWATLTPSERQDWIDRLRFAWAG